VESMSAGLIKSSRKTHQREGYKDSGFRVVDFCVDICLTYHSRMVLEIGMIQYTYQKTVLYMVLVSQRFGVLYREDN
jgi:hypothetical protein